MVFNGKLSHAYIISSASETARTEAARDLAAAMVCSSGDGVPRPCLRCAHCRKALEGIHPDITVTKREKDEKGKLRAEIVIDQIRNIGKDALILPNEAEKKVYIIQEADVLNTAAQNAFLKLLEEPPRHACFILCVENSRNLLTTVRSRCVEINIHAQPQEPQKKYTDMAETYIGLVISGKTPELLSFFASNGDMEKDEVASFLDAAEYLLAEALCKRREFPGADRESIASLLENVSTARKYFSVNVSQKHIFGMLAVV